MNEAPFRVFRLHFWTGIYFQYELKSHSEYKTEFYTQ